MANGPKVNVQPEQQPQQQVPVETDQEAWNASAVNRGYSLFNLNGTAVVVGKAFVKALEKTRLFVIPPMEGFAQLPQKSRDLAFHSTAQFAAYRVAQNVDGEAVSSAIAKIMEGNLPSAKNNDAAESVYLEWIAERINDKHPLPEKPSEEETAERENDIKRTAEDFRATVYDKVILQALKASDVVVPAKQRQRAKATPTKGTSRDIDIGMLDAAE